MDPFKTTGRCPTCGLEDPRYYRAKLEYIARLEADLGATRTREQEMLEDIAHLQAELDSCREA